jgi:hypothetical protein
MSPSSIPICAQEPSHGKLRRMLTHTGIGVGSNFRVVTDLELKRADDGIQILLKEFLL